MTKDEALKLALEALENVRSYDKENLYGLDEDITALRTAIEAAESQQPVAWKNVLPGGRKTDDWESARLGDYNRGWNDYRKAAKAALEKLYTTLPAA